MRSPMRITIPEGEGRRRRSREKEDNEEKKIPTDLRSKRPVALKRKKKKSKQTTRRLTDSGEGLIPVPLTAEEEET